MKCGFDSCTLYRVGTGFLWFSGLGNVAIAAAMLAKVLPPLQGGRYRHGTELLWFGGLGNVAIAARMLAKESLSIPWRALKRRAGFRSVMGFV